MFPSPSSSTPLPVPGRRCWKKTKERHEAVWPPALEAALIGALEKYRPANCRNSQLLRRFPKRNQFISDHIFAVTGKRRTAKQVGSRLQQMRETCGDERIRNLLSRRDYSTEPEEDSLIEPEAASDSSMYSTAPSPVASASTSEIADNGTASGSLPLRTFVTIEFVSPPGFVVPYPEQNQSKASRTNQHHISLDYPSDIDNNCPTLTFATERKISASQHYSQFRVLIGGRLAHSEITGLTFASTSFTPSPNRTERHTYNIILIPLFWAHLCRTEQLFQCAIEQDIMKTLAPFDSLPASPSPEDQCIRSVTYDFTVSRTTAPVFRPPPLLSEPLLPPGFPDGERSSRVPATIRGNDAYFMPSEPSSFPPAQYAPAEYAIYGSDDHYSATPPAGSFSSTSFCQDEFPASSASPYAPYDYIQYLGASPSPFGPSDFESNQWPSALYDNSNNTTIPSIWSDVPMYSELNSRSF
ncbi:hypothetical protein DFH06DRAFT_1188862 [Mycena polygramma]|nr:hypothetical protein DFH06DRAFT_1188862 [Mycena polygramma]